MQGRVICWHGGSAGGAGDGWDTAQRQRWWWTPLLHSSQCLLHSLDTALSHCLFGMSGEQWLWPLLRLEKVVISVVHCSLRLQRSPTPQAKVFKDCYNTLLLPGWGGWEQEVIYSPSPSWKVARTHRWGSSLLHCWSLLMLTLKTFFHCLSEACGQTVPCTLFSCCATASEHAQSIWGTPLNHLALVAGSAAITELHGAVTIGKTVHGRPQPPGHCTEGRINTTQLSPTQSHSHKTER